MLFLPFILVLSCYFLHKLADEKGVSPWGYVGGYVTGFFVILFATAAAIIFFYGVHVLSDQDGPKEIQSLLPFAWLFQFLLFVFFRRRIERIPDYHDEDDDNNQPSNGGKKDLSYFR